MSARDLIFTVFGIDKASKTFDDVGTSMDRMASIGIKSFGALSGAAAAGAGAVAASLALVPLAFVGIGAAAVKENAEVRRSFADLSNTLRTGLAQDAAPMAETFVDSAHEIARAYHDLRPELREGFIAAKPHVEALTRGVTGFAREAVPGMVTAVQKAGPVFDGLEHFLVDAGRGLGDFFEIVSAGAPGAGAFFDDMGDLTEGVLPDVARLLVELTGLWEQHGDQAVRVIDDLIGTVVDLGTHAMPIASDAMGVGLDVLEGILAVIGPIADDLGPLIGLWISLSTAMRLMGAVTGVVENVTTSVSNFRKEMGTAAGPQGIEKVKTVATGVMGLLGGPWGIALAAATVGLAMYGQESEQAAADQRTLAAALKESAGAFDANARKAILNSDAYKDISGSVTKAGISHSELIDALTLGGGTFDSLKKRLNDTVVAEHELAKNTKGGADSMTEKGAAAAALLFKLDGLRGGVVGATDDFKKEQDAVNGSKAAMIDAVPGSAALTGAMKTLRDITADTASRADALNTAWREMFGVQITLQEATAGYLEGLSGIRSQIDDVKKSVDDWRGVLLTSDGQVNLSTEQGRKLLSSLVDQGGAYRELAQTAYDSALRQTGSQEQATAAAQRAVSERRNQFITEMQQMGFTEGQAKRLADTYLGMPDDVLTFIKLTGADDFEAAVKYATRNRAIDVFLNQRQGSKVAPDWLTGGMNDGGLVPGGGPDRDTVAMALTPGEFVVKRSATRRWLPVLERINRSAGGDAVLDMLAGQGFAPARGGGSDLGTPGFGAVTVQAGPERIVLEIRSGGSRMDDLLVEIIQRAVNNRGGDVLAVLGGRPR